MDAEEWKVSENIIQTDAVFCFDWTTDSKYFAIEYVSKKSTLWRADQRVLVEVNMEEIALETLVWKTGSILSSWNLTGFRNQLSLTSSKQVCCQCKSLGMRQQEIFVAGFSDGTIRIYQYPVLFDRAEFIEFRAHKGRVGSVCMVPDNTYIISSGYDDGCIIVWKLKQTRDKGFIPEMIVNQNSMPKPRPRINFNVA